MGTPRNLETQNRHLIQDAGSAGKACWFLQQQSKVPKEEHEYWYSEETMSILSYQESPAQTGDNACDKGRMESVFPFRAQLRVGKAERTGQGLWDLALLR